MLKIYIGFDTREVIAWRVLAHSIYRHARKAVQIQPIILGDLQYRGLYERPTSLKEGRLWDDISEAPMSTEFAISRFLVPQLAGGGWALFMDADMLATTDINKVFDGLEPDKAVYCVKHEQKVSGEQKMDNQVQLPYTRKNWSSFMLFNCDHEANKRLTVGMVNTLPGRDLHRFCWLKDEEIGALPLSWNWLEGYSDPISPINIIHYTRGGPWMKGLEYVGYSDLWLRERALIQ